MRYNEALLYLELRLVVELRSVMEFYKDSNSRGKDMGLRDRRKQPTSHAYIGYLATGFAGVAALSGWSAVWTLGVPSFVTPFIKAQLFIGAPGFFTEAVNGILAITKKRDWRRHRKHMTLAVIGTVADAGNG